MTDATLSSHERTSAPHRLLPGEAHALLPRRGTRLRVLEGRLWLTESGRQQDRFLVAGDEWPMAAPGRVVIEADGGAPAAWCLVRPAGAAGSVRRLGKWVNGWALACHAAIARPAAGRHRPMPRA